jgi:hypothetical protein
MDAPLPGNERRIVGLTGVYHANGSFTGELTYWVGARLGRAHCALCDITHGLFRAKADFARCRDGLPVPFHAVHLDERSPEIVAVTEGRTPCVVAVLEGPDGITTSSVLLDPDALEACDGEPEAFVVALEAAADAAGLSWS